MASKVRFTTELVNLIGFQRPSTEFV